MVNEACCEHVPKVVVMCMLWRPPAYKLLIRSAGRLALLYEVRASARVSPAKTSALLRVDSSHSHLRISVRCCPKYS
jgi:hypothetical protein